LGVIEASLWPFFIEFIDKGGKVPELLIIWIKNILIPYWIGGNAIKPPEKGGFGALPIVEA
jgi:hypothetical protein